MKSGLPGVRGVVVLLVVVKDSIPAIAPVGATVVRQLNRMKHYHATLKNVTVSVNAFKFN